MPETRLGIPSIPRRADANRSSLPTVFSVVGVAAILYVGREVFQPLAVAVLLTFTLAPIVNFLRRYGLPKIPSVIMTVSVAFAAIALFSFIVASQVSNLAQNAPTYQTNILNKIQSLREWGASGGVMDKLTGAVHRVGAELERVQAGPSDPVTPSAKEPMPVEVVSRQSPLETLKNVIVPLFSPFATAGLIIVVVIFMLLEREDLRDRFIRLAGASDIHRITQAMQDAGSRVGQYLLMQLVINTLYALPITIGLFVLGIPNALLWGMLTLVLRFVPYIGPAIGMTLPLLLALAVAPGWSLVFWTAGLFIVMELISNNVLEPWLYGSRTGLSSMSIIVAAIFWTWLWGALGLVLSTPLTVCLVVLGRYVPQFGFLDVLLGNEPVLQPHERLYQRLLAGDPDEATDNAEKFLEEKYLVTYYDEVGLPALMQGERDRQRGVMPADQLAEFAGSANTLVNNLREIAEEEEAEADALQAVEAGATTADSTERVVDIAPDDEVLPPDLPDGEGRTLLCVGGRGPIDDVAAAMLAQVLEVQGANARVVEHGDLELRGGQSLTAGGADTVLVAIMNEMQIAPVRYLVRRLKRANRAVRVGVLMPGANGGTLQAADIHADFVATSIAAAVTESLSSAVADPQPLAHRRVLIQRPGRKRPGGAVAVG